jgi:hypothetical protein
VTETRVTNNVLYALAQTMSSREDYPIAVALRKLARAGYSSLEQVDRTSDWVLLAIPGMGIGRLTAVRRLVRPDWQPPQPRFVKVVERFLSAARLALRFWSIDDLEAVIQGSVALPSDDRPVEKRLSLEQFAQATRKALRHWEVEELVQALRQACNHAGPRPNRTPASLIGTVPGREAKNNGQSTTRVRRSSENGNKPLIMGESQHFAFGANRRREIVADYRAARAAGTVANKEQWARTNHGISARTLLRYERELPGE